MRIADGAGRRAAGIRTGAGALAPFLILLACHAVARFRCRQRLRSQRRRLARLPLGDATAARRFVLSERLKPTLHRAASVRLAETRLRGSVRHPEAHSARRALTVQARGVRGRSTRMRDHGPWPRAPRSVAGACRAQFGLRASGSVVGARGRNGRRQPQRLRLDLCRALCLLPSAGVVRRGRPGLESPRSCRRRDPGRSPGSPPASARAFAERRRRRARPRAPPRRPRPEI